MKGSWTNTYKAAWDFFSQTRLSKQSELKCKASLDEFNSFVLGEVDHRVQSLVDSPEVDVF